MCIPRMMMASFRFFLVSIVLMSSPNAAAAVDSPPIDTNQVTFYGVTEVLPSIPTESSDPFYGQDAQYAFNRSQVGG
jgi:opacity protein-like surface antigen